MLIAQNAHFSYQHHTLECCSWRIINCDFLQFQENEIVNVLYEINQEWLYGSNVRGDYGQFPANFIEYVPHNLPQMPK